MSTRTPKVTRRHALRFPPILAAALALPLAAPAVTQADDLEQALVPLIERFRALPAHERERGARYMAELLGNWLEWRETTIGRGAA